MSLNKEIKAFLFDIDGTLINRQLEMSNNTKNALKILKDKGYHLSINTGRPSFAIEKVLGLNGVADLFEYYFGYNGIEVFNVKTKEISYISTISSATIKELDQIFSEDYLSLCTYDNDNNIQFNHYPKSKEKLKEWSELRFTKPKLFDFQKNTMDYAKAIVLFDLDKKEEFLNKIKDFKDDRVDLFFSGIDVIEIVPKGLNKGRSVSEYAKMLGIKEKEILCCGDAESDLPALKKGTGVLIGSPELDPNNEVAYHTGTVHEDGLYNFLKNNSFLD